MRFQVKLIMFDLDGTLLDTAPQIAQAANKMLAALDLPMLSQAQISTYIGEGVQTLIKRCLTVHLNVEPDLDILNRGLAIFQECYAANVADSQAFNTVLPTLQKLQQLGYRLACVTNKPEKFALPLLKKASIDRFLECVVCGDTLPRKKPDPMPLLHLCEKLGVSPLQAMMVGDSDTDIQAARAAGCLVVTVPYGYNQGRSIDVDTVDATIDEMVALVDLLEPPVVLNKVHHF